MAGSEAANRLAIVRSTLLRSLTPSLLSNPIFPNTKAVADYLQLLLAEKPVEQLRVLFLDTRHRLIRDEVVGIGTIIGAPCNPRDILRRALELGAAALILVHNHPSGDPTPSEQDIATTRQVYEAAQSLQIEVIDHLVVARSGIASFRSRGLMPGVPVESARA